MSDTIQLTDSNRPDPLEGPSFPLKPLGYILLAVAGIPLLAFNFGLGDALLHPIALCIGKPTTALVSSKYVSRERRTAGKYVELNYQYSPDYAPRPTLKVNGAAYAAIVLQTRVAIHYIPGCSSCIALDEDYGSARQQGLVGLGILILICAWTFRKKI